MTPYCHVLLRRLLLLVVVVVLSVTGIQHDVERCRVCTETAANGAKKLPYGIMIRSRKAIWVDDVGEYAKAICPLQP